ncbi:uncharacterized protein LOC115328655 [Ixodes scapularis]|uniref:uncharacterized protein LOC115328655 n=1 Tax=Ixodes scapularis TaxID=6945 RepID=UPI001A9EA821|nr:uncharacterized protein LOC115328655 [Ixodes scapularis]
MSTLRGTICLWLCLMYAGVECWPKVRLSSRQEVAKGIPAITMVFYIDDSVNVTDEKVEKYLRSVTWQATDDLEHYFLLNGIDVKYWIRRVEKEPNLKTALSFDKRNRFAYVDGAISTLLAYFERKNNPDINVLLTGIKLYKGYDIRNSYGYSEDKTLCQSFVPMLLAYAPDRPYSVGRMLAELIRNSVNHDNVPYVHNRLARGFKQKMKNYLSTCGRDPQYPEGENPVTPPDVEPTDNPDHTETPLLPNTVTPPVEPPAPSPPAPEPPSETPSEPGEQPPPPPEPTPTTGVPDFC